MKIGLNALAFDAGRMGGVETYFRQLLHYLPIDDDANDYLLVCKNSDVNTLNVQNQAVSIKTFNIGRPSLPWLIRRTIFELTHIDIIKSSINRLPVDLLHHPFSSLEPLNLKIPSVLTFWDMQHEFFPRFFSRQELRFRHYAYQTSAQQARRVIVSSEFTRNCLVERYGLKHDKIDFIYPGYGAEYHPMVSNSALDIVKRKYHLPDEFIYYPAALWPHKNHTTLLDAVALVRDRYGIKINLILSGMSTGRNKEFRSEIISRGLEPMVKVLGYLPYEDVPVLYNLASLMVFPSLFEGFGIPLVESMACGCPVACSNSASMPEIVGNAALLFDPYSAQEIAASIFKVMDDKLLQKKMKMAGLEQAKLFDWRQTARLTRTVYEKACN